MHASSKNPREPSEPQVSIAPKRHQKLRLLLIRTADILLFIEPLWMILAVSFVFISYLLDIGSMFPWIGLALACLPFLIRMLRRKTVGLGGTPFDLPMFLLIMAAVIGFCTSPNRPISLGALQCILAISLFYYSWVNQKHQAILIKRLLILVPITFLIVLLLFVLDLPGLSIQPNFAIGSYGTHHGLAMYFVVVAAVLLGVAAFSTRTGIRYFAAIIFLLFFTVVLVVTWDSIRNLFDGGSVSGRLPVWERTATLLRESPVTGLGLGCWALKYYNTTVLESEITHAHNAYLELYSNFGIVGVLALIIALGIGIKLSLDIIRSPRNRPWYGFGVGVVAACLAVLVVGVFESAPVGVPLTAAETYHYVISPLPWILCGLLVIAHRLVTGNELRPVQRPQTFR